MSNKLFIIGASSYIGNKIISSAKSEWDVIGTSTRGSDITLKFDLTQPEDFDYSRVKPNDTLILCAGISSPDLCSLDKEFAYRVNVIGTRALITKIIGKGAKVIFFSTDAVYGENSEIFTEASICNPFSEYATMKHAIELDFLNNCNFKSIRLSYVFSAEDKFTKYLRTCSKNNVEAEVFHPFYRNIIHVDDVVTAVVQLSRDWDRYPQSIFNFGGPDLVSRIEIATTLQKIALPQLLYKVVQPGKDFFQRRPSCISIKSSLLVDLLQKLPNSLVDSVRIELNKNLYKS